MNKNSSYCVILAGGIGSRFWPYSRRSKPKQFLDFFGTGQTLFQTTYKRMAKIFDEDKIYITTNQNYLSIVKEQLPKIPEEQILTEPCRRNTATAIAYASLHIAAKDANATICFAPSDHLVLQQDVFAEDMEKAVEYVQEKDVLLTLGIAPSRADVGYGYIQLNGSDLEVDPVGSFFPVKTFTEKPKKEIADIFLASGEFFWNSGMLFAKAMVLIVELKTHMPELMERLLPKYSKDLHPYNTPEEESFIDEIYPYCPNISMDYGVMEKSDRVHVLICDFGWADLGTWGSIYDIGEKNENENVHLHPLILENNSSGNLVISDEKDKLIIAQGIKDTYIIEKNNVLLLCKRGEEDKLKQVVLQAINKGEEFID